jgi:uncharacterized protein YhhL (DUF1145 family)
MGWHAHAKGEGQRECGEGVVWVVVFFNVMADFPRNITFPCGMWHVAFQMMYTILNIV